jgi:hypothetical protein
MLMTRFHTTNRLHLTILQYNFAVKNEKQKKRTVRTIPQSNSKIDAPSAEIHDHPLSWRDTGTSVYMIVELF